MRTSSSLVPRLSTALLLAAALTACSTGSAVTDTHAAERRVVPYTSTGADEPGAFTEASPPAPKPPEVELVVVTSHGRRRAPGVLYTSDWVMRDVRFQRDPAVPVPWPPPLGADRPRSVELLFHTPTPPDELLVKAFARVDDRRQEPESDPVAVYECSRSSNPSCAISPVPGGRIRVSDMPAGLLRAGYIVVFCTWAVPPRLQAESPDSAADLSASWLFRVDSRE